MEKNQVNNIQTLFNKENICSPKLRVSISSENKKLSSSGSKKRISDRFIPSSIGKNLFINDFDSNIRPLNTENPSQFKSQTVKKSEINYQKILQSEIIEESTPKFNENIGTKGVLDLFKINRQLKYHTEVKKVRKLKINKENSVDSIESLPYGEAEKKIKIEKACKSFNFENVSDNFYLNSLDIYDYNKIALGTKSQLVVFDANQDSSEKSFHRFKFDSPHEIYNVKFINSNKLLFSDSNFSLKIKDMTKDIEILKFDVIQRKFLTIDFMKYNENVLFLGSDNSSVDLYDLRYKNKVTKLYSHDKGMEVCKLRFSNKNNYVISGGNDNRIKIFDLRKSEILATFQHKAAIKGMALNSDETLLASGGGTFDKTIKLWDMKKLQIISELLTDSQITNVEFLPYDKIAVSNGYISNNIVLYQLNVDLLNNPDSVTSASSNNIITQSSANKESLNMFNKISIFEKHNKRILYMSKSRCNNYITSCSTDGNVKIWKVSKFIQQKKFAENSIYCGIR